jgi:AcrR family transcriptional regulator
MVLVFMVQGVDGVVTVTPTQTARSHPRAAVGDASTEASTALGVAALKVSPLVQERRGTALRDTEGVARRLTRAAIDLFVVSGFDAVTVTEIAERAGVNRRTFFRYFPSKETVVLDIFDQTNTALLDRIVSTPGADVFSVVGDALVAWCEEFEELLTGLADVSEQSRSLTSVILLRSAEWEDYISEALLRRFPELADDVADLAGVVAMNSLRLARKRQHRPDPGYPERVRAVLQGFGRFGPEVAAL